MEELMLFKVFLGIGVLALPFGFSQVGLLLGVVMYAVITYTCLYTQMLMIQLSWLDSSNSESRYEYLDDNKTPELKESQARTFVKPIVLKEPVDSLAQVCKIYKWGEYPLGEKLCNWSVMASQIGFTISYLIFIGENTDALVCHASNNCGNNAWYIFASLFILIPISFYKNIKDLSWLTIYGNIAIFLGLIMVLYTALYVPINSDSSNDSKVALNNEFVWANISGIPYFMGIAAFMFEGLACVLPIQKASRNPQKFHLTFNVVINRLFMFTTIFSVICYTNFQNFTREIVLLNVTSSAMGTFVKIMYMVGILMTYNIQMLPVFQTVQNSDWFQAREDQDRMRIATNVGLICLTGLVAMLIPSFSLFVNLIGSVACGILLFILPPLCYIHALAPLYNEDEMRWVRYTMYLIFAFGIVICALGAYVSIVDIFYYMFN